MTICSDTEITKAAATPYCEFITSSATDTAWVVVGPETFVPLVHHCNYSLEKYLECVGHTCDQP